jgi:hypothetical protein
MSDAGAVSTKKLRLADLCSGLGLKPVTPVSGAGNRAALHAVPKESPPEMDVVCKDGERTDHLTKLAGKLISQRRPLEDVISLAKEWDSRNTPPLNDNDKVTATCESIWKTHQRNHPPAEVAGELTPLFPLAEARIDKFVINPPPKRLWLLNDCLPFGKVGALIAPGGTGKSQFLLQLAVSVATGMEFLGWEIGESGGVLCLFAEDDEEEIHRRLFHIASHAGLCQDIAPEPYAKLLTNLHVKSMVARDNLMTVADHASGEVVPTDYSERLLLVTREIPDLKLIVIDPGSRFRGGDENFAQDTTRFVEALEYVSRRTGANVLVAHHANKGSMNGGEQTQGAQRGSSAFTDGVRWQMNLSYLGENDLDNYGIRKSEKRGFLKASVVKNNYGPPSEELLLQREEDGYLVVSDRTADAEGAEAVLWEKVRQILHGEARCGITYSKTSFEGKFGGTGGGLRLGVGKNTLRRLLNAWIDEEKLCQDAKGRLYPDGLMPSGWLEPSDKIDLKSTG